MELLIEENLVSQFESMSYTHRRGYAGWVAEAKKTETRERRLEKVIQALKTRTKLF